jgi:hypothetical protein
MLTVTFKFFFKFWDSLYFQRATLFQLTRLTFKFDLIKFNIKLFKFDSSDFR